MFKGQPKGLYALALANTGDILDGEDSFVRHNDASYLFYEFIIVRNVKK